MAQAAVLGGAAWLAFIGVAELGLLEPSLATLGAAIIIGVVGRLLARRFKAPAALWVVPAILPLLPGLQLVQAMLAPTDVERVAGLLAAAGTAFLVGTGVASGDILVHGVPSVRDDLVGPAVDAVTGGIEDYIVEPVERRVGRSARTPADRGAAGDDGGAGVTPGRRGAGVAVAVLRDLARPLAVDLGARRGPARNPSTIRLYIENAAAMSTASWTSASVAPASWAAATSSAVRSRGSPLDGPGDVEQGPHLGVEPSEEPVLMTSMSGGARSSPSTSRSGGREGAVRVHAEEAVVGRGHGRREHLALGG